MRISLTGITKKTFFFFLKFPPPLFVPHFKVDIQLPSSLKEGLTQHEYETEILLHMKGDKGKKKKADVLYNSSYLYSRD